MQNVQNKFFFLLLVFLFFYTVYLLSPVLTPFLTGAFLAYLANPFVNYLVRWKIPRTLSVTIVFCLFITLFVALLFLLVPMIEKQIRALIESIPKILAWIQMKVMPLVQEYFDIDNTSINVDEFKNLLLENTGKAQGFINWLLKTTLASSVRIIEWLMNFILIPVVTFYLLCDWNKLLNGLRKLLPRRIEPTVVKILKECDQVLNAFFRGQFIVMIALATIYSIGLSLVGLQVGLLVGLISGLFSIVPYLGSIIGIVVATIAALVQFGEFTPVLLVWAVFGIGHLIDNFYLTPKLVGDRIGLHPVAVIFSILAGGYLFGFTGVLLALPVAAFTMVWVRYLNKQYFNSKLYNT